MDLSVFEKYCSEKFWRSRGGNCSWNSSQMCGGFCPQMRVSGCDCASILPKEKENRMASPGLTCFIGLVTLLYLLCRSCVLVDCISSSERRLPLQAWPDKRALLLIYRAVSGVSGSNIHRSEAPGLEKKIVCNTWFSLVPVALSLVLISRPALSVVLNLLESICSYFTLFVSVWKLKITVTHIHPGWYCIF